MAPNISVPTGVLHEQDDEIVTPEIPKECVEPENRKPQLVWRNIILFAYLHVAALYGLYLMFTSARIYTSLWGKQSPKLVFTSYMLSFATFAVYS